MDRDDLVDGIVDHSRRRYYRDDPVRWVWILYGLAQATVTMLMAFGVIETTTAAAVVTAVALIVYVGVNEIWVRPIRTRARESTLGAPQTHDQPPDAPQERPYDREQPATSDVDDSWSSL